MGINVEQITTFMKSMRTRFGKLSSEETGKGAQDLSFREQWIYDNFTFLKTHIDKERQSRVSLKVNK